MAEQKNIRNKRRGGFTTVELIVVIVLLMILASGLVFGIMKWVEYSNFKRQNEYARTIFVSAQNQLTEYSRSGKLEELAEKLKNDNGEYQHVVNVDTLRDSEGNPYADEVFTALEKVWPESAGKTNGSVYRDTICYINVTAADYQAYLNGTATEEATVFYDMVSEYLYDMSILNASVCIEFTPEEGQVFSVLYSDRAEGFEYNRDNSNKTGIVDVSNRETSYRKARMVGYYGVDTLYRATSTKAEKPSITDVRLNNEETLNLSFKLGKVSSATQELMYEINVYDKITERVMFKLLLDGTGIKNESVIESGKANVPCAVYRYSYKDDGSLDKEVNMGQYNVMSWIDDDGLVRVILDAADLAATSSVYYEAYPQLMADSLPELTLALDKLKKTYSIRRFGVKSENIYCTIQGSGAYYKTTAKKQSNTENASFGSAQTGTSGGEATASYTIKNMRHLYNLRYMEDYTEGERMGDYAGLQTVSKISYLLDATMDWDTFIDNGSLYNNGSIAVERIDADNNVIDIGFPAIKRLRSGSEFKSNSSRAYTISGLTLTNTVNEKAGLYTGGSHAKGGKKDSTNGSHTIDDGITDGCAGLFLMNEGSIENVTLDAVTVSGTNKVGAFCAVNTGSLAQLAVANSDNLRESTVSGEQYVGGITGYQQGPSNTDTGETLYDELTNRARVTGEQYVGGITGYLETETKESITVKDCKNYGQIGVSEAAKADEAMYIGGIVGYAKAAVQGESNNSGRLEITGCVSSPQYSSQEIGEIIGSDAELKKKLKGIYVGGIAGYNDGGIIYNCNTRKESALKEGYIFGYNYVGGIVGYNAGAGNGSAKLDGDVSRLFNNKNSINAAHVIGSSYVGGITGCNALAENQSNAVISPSRATNDRVIVSNWTNQGVVIACEDYAGGITGFNSGIIEDCGSDVDNSETVRALTKSESLRGDYVGGIAGYNSGTLTASKTMSAVCYVSGTNYLGGIVGYNASSAVVNNYAVGGGYIIGHGCFVGGFAGLNASQNLINNVLDANPNEVSGTYCVGGMLGGNMAEVDDYNALTANFKTNNFLGTLKAEAFAGGFIGYNVMLKKNGLEVGDNDKIRLAADAAIEAFDKLENLEAAEDILKKMVSNLKISDTYLLISGKLYGGTEENTQTQLGSLTAKIYVGGVVGYNDASTNLQISDVINLTPVTATAFIHNPEEQKGRENAETFTYSYAGGIIGKVSDRVILTKCKNQDVGDVVSQGTYLGGLCEVNEGIITECSVSNIGTDDKDYVGGITGLNKSGARIVDTDFVNKTVTGRNYVGGVSAENFGIIETTVLKNAKIVASSYAGGFTGYSYTNAQIKVEPDDQNINITAAGSNIGGLVGYNDGEISIGLSSMGGDKRTRAAILGSITGGSNVGGVIGYNTNDDKAIEDFDNMAAIIAENGDAGGIVGAGTANTRITGCENSGSIQTIKGGNAGGIIGMNAGSISDCRDIAAVSSLNGMCGGIAGVNTGTITNSHVASDGLTFIGKIHAGGITGYNQGSNAHIEDSSVSGIVVTNPAEGSSGSILGGITGLNEGVVARCSVSADQDDTPVTLISNASNVSVGGIAGINKGTIQGTQDALSTVYANVSFTQTNQAYYGNLGGIAGSNPGTIEYCEFNGTVKGTGNNPQLSPEYNPNTDFETNGAIIYGYGGIAGVNGNSGTLSSGIIRNCKVNVAKITGLGDPNNVANIGGVAGVNGLGALISEISFGTGDTYSVSNNGIKSSTLKSVKEAKADVYVGTDGNTTAYGHTGGVAGLNNGSIMDIGFDSANKTYSVAVDDTAVIVENYRGHVGGIVGHNRRTGVIQNVSNGKKWIVYAPQNAQDNGCGGIVGYQAFDNTMSYCINRAIVEKTASNSNGVGGIIGRMETATGSGFSVINCTNYGKVVAERRAGGIIGTWKYYGGTVADCINYGEITSKSNEGTGGIVGSCYVLTTTAASILRCENHGIIMSENGFCGGIVGNETGSGKCFLEIQKCVNTGLVKNGDNNGGIIGGLGEISNKSFIKDCTNYGYGIGGTNIGGIVAKNAEPIKVSGCLNVPPVNWPISARAGNDQGNNYYLTDKELEPVNYRANGTVMEEEPQAFYVKSFYTNASDSPGTVNKLVFEGGETADNNYNTRPYHKNTSSDEINLVYTFTFNRPILLDELDLYWNRQGNEGRMTDYAIYYSPYTENIPDLLGNWSLFADIENTTAGVVLKDEKETVSRDTPVLARRVKIVVRRSVNSAGAGVNACLIRTYFKGTVSGQAYDGFNGYLVKGEDNKLEPQEYSNSSGALKWDSANRKYTGLGYQLYQFSGTENKGIGWGLNVRSADTDTFRLTFGDGSTTIGLPGIPLDPLTVLRDDNNAKTDASLKACGDQTDNIRYEVFSKVHKYLDIYVNSEITELDSPKNLSWSDVGSATYRVLWDSVPNASYYNYKADYKDNDGNIIETKTGTVYDNNVDLLISAEKNIKTISFYVSAGVVVNTGATVESAEHTLEIAVLPVLPAPQYHMELEYSKNNQGNLVFRYRAYLDNQEEYLEFLQKTLQISREDAQKKLDKVTIKIYKGTGEIENLAMNAATGKSSDLYAGDDGNKVYSAFASYTESGIFTSSAKPLRESMALTNDTIIGNTNVANVTLKPNNKDVGFMGITAATLSYQLKIAYNKSILYMRSELMATDMDLQIPVAVSTSQLRTSDTTTSAVPTSLSSLPENLLDSNAYTDLTVRSYPALMSNNIVYMGHTVDISAVKEQDQSIGLHSDTLLRLFVTDSNGVTDKDPGNHKKLISETVDDEGKTVRTLADGFVIELAADGTYTLYYNSLLASNGSDFGAENNVLTQFKQNQVFYLKLGDDRETMPQPIIHINDGERTGVDGDPNAETMVITWDLQSYLNEDGKNNYKVGAVYDYIITGYTSDGDTAQIAAGDFTTNKNEENILTYDTSTWNYTKVRISISRRGTANNGMTSVFPSGTVLELPLKLRFSQITRPDVTLHKEGGVVQKNSLVYDITWRNIPENERIPSGDTTLSDVKAYEVTVEPTSGNTAGTVSYDNAADFTTALEKAKDFYDGKSKAAVPEDGTKATYQWKGSGDGWSVTKTMVLTWNDTDGQWSITRHLTQVWSFTADDDMRRAGTLTKTLDLNDYGRGENIAFSVRAIARPEADAAYSDSPKGVVRELTLPSRMDVPGVSALNLVPAYGLDTSMTMEAFKAGLELRMVPSDESGVLQGKYELAIAVYDTRANDDSSKVKNSGDGDGEQSDYWNTGALETLSTKASPAVMDGNLTSAVYELYPKDIYAGKWLKIAMRSISESNVSSLWSDEDETTDGTINYRWLRIPRIQVETPEIKQGTETLYYDEAGNPGLDAGSLNVPVVQTSLSFDLVSNADQYQLQIIRSNKDSGLTNMDTAYTEAYIDWIYLEKALDGQSYNVFYTSSDPDFDPEPFKKPEHPVSLMNKNAVFLGNVSAGMVWLPYGDTVFVSAEESLKTASFIKLESDADGRQTLTLVLPDAQDIGSMGVNGYLFTSQVSVQAKVSEGLAERYADSKISDWYRNTDGSTTVVTLDNYGDAPVLELSLAGSAREGTAYEIRAKARNWLVYELTVLDGGDNAIFTDYISACGSGVAEIDTIALLSDNDYGKFKGSTLSIRVAAIIKGELSGSSVSGGLSAWTNPVEFVLPDLVLSAPEVTRTEHSQAIGGTLSDGMDMQNVDLKAQSFTWVKDTKADGYDITVAGQTFSVKDTDMAGSEKRLTLTAQTAVATEQGDTPETYEQTQSPETNQSRQDSQPEDTTSSDQSDSLPDTAAETPAADQTDTAAAGASRMPNERRSVTTGMGNSGNTETKTYVLSADVYLTITVTGEEIRYELIVPERRQLMELEGTSLTFDLGQDASDYVVITPTAEDYGGQDYIFR